MDKRLRLFYDMLTAMLCAAAVAAMVLLVFARFGLYPFGSRTAAWCDMNQQVVPLLCQFKDILEGKSGFFLSFKNASGMNFWGVFFFFLASPFSLLVKFVQKSDMLLFMNILIILKMSVCAFTACLYFLRSDFAAADRLAAGLLGAVYAVSGYVMLFYQNIIWLDMMYLFPLLMLSLEKLRCGRGGMYIAISAAMITVNYYIGYMTVVFLLLFAATYVLICRKAEGENAAAVCGRFLVCSAISALLSAVVWLPSLVQYMSSGRKSSLFQSLTESDFITDYETVLPVITCSALLIFLAAAEIFSKREKPAGERLFTAMLLLLLTPIFLEPVNKM